jgi:murein DD-endopeptidase MepM/ murein hydrolase activator NlpD
MSQNVPINSLIVLLSCLLLLVACAPTGIYHTVQPGQTLYRIAKTYEIDESRLASINHIKDPKQLKVSQKLFIPGATQRRTVPVTAATTTVGTSPRVTSSPSPPTQNKTVPKTSKPTANKPVVSTPTHTSTPAKGIFIWPLKGKVLNNFGKQGQNVYKGIEISAPKGTAVVAAASGKVIYSGNAIPGYGNLVILEHSDSYFSVYGFNDETLVKMNDHVGQGEKIALSGLPPSGQSARLHFEIRKGKSAVNPILYLP